MQVTRLPIKMWLEDIEEGALQQAINLANLPFAFKHIALARLSSGVWYANWGSLSN